MKRRFLIALLLPALLLLGACGEKPLETDKTAAFIPGESSGQEYRSEFLGLRFACETVSFYTNGEIAKLNGYDPAIVPESERAALFENARTIFDMYAGNYLYDTVNICFENTELIYGERLTAEAYRAKKTALLPQSFRDAGVSVISLNEATCTLAGYGALCIETCVDVSGNTVYEREIYLQKGQYMAIICTASVDPAGLNALLADFSRI